MPRTDELERRDSGHIVLHQPRSAGQTGTKILPPDAGPVRRRAGASGRRRQTWLSGSIQRRVLWRCDGTTPAISKLPCQKKHAHGTHLRGLRSPASSHTARQLSACLRENSPTLPILSPTRHPRPSFGPLTYFAGSGEIHPQLSPVYRARLQTLPPPPNSPSLPNQQRRGFSPSSPPDHNRDCNTLHILALCLSNSPKALRVGARRAMSSTVPSTRPSQSLPFAFSSDPTLATSSSDHIFNSMPAHVDRDSYASTTPSSLESYHHDAQPSDPSKPESPSKSSNHTFSFKSAARTFTFSSKNKPPPIPDHDAATIAATRRTGPRERAMTESSYASTAIPPKLDLGTDLNLGSSDFGSGFGDMFAKRRSALLEEQTATGPNATRSVTDSHLLSTNPRPTVGSPNSSTSLASDDRLMDMPSLPNYFGTAEYEPTFGVDADAELLMSAVNSGRFLNEGKKSQPRQLADRSRAPNGISSTPLRAAAPSHQSGSSFGSGRTAIPTTPRAGMFGSAEIDRDTTPKAKGEDLDDEPLFDPSKSARFAQFNTRNMNQPKQPSKVMTPAEFEHYKTQKDNGELDDDDKSQASEESETYEDEDETERERQVAKQRRKQEAQLAVYRQQMMKVTGEQPSELPSDLSRPKLGRQSMSTPNLLNKTYSTLDPLASAKDEDDDEDIPLGVLQAHGFPSKNRPPSRLTLSGRGSRPASHMGSYPAPPGSTRNDAASGGGGNGSLPVFARHLPQDPYVGASLVNQPNRESMALGGGSPQSVHGGSSGLPPGGLVGVIAGEERARAMRRGSPNTRGTYDDQPLPPQMQPPMTTNGMPGMPMMPMSPSEQAQMHMSSQMQQMMQVQMQWMQQMMQMQGMSPQQMQMMPGMQGMQMPGMQMPPPQNGFLSPKSQRPVSQASNHQRSHSRQSFLMPNGGLPGSGQSLYGPSSSQSMYGMPAAGYAPSIAPSERTNIGQPSRYRPVSSAGVDTSRTSTMSQNTIQALQSQGSRAPSRLGPGDGNRNTIIRAVDRPKKTSHASDDEDEEGWAELKKKKEERKSRWRRTKKAVAAHDENVGMEGLYYEG
ncbi:hypothetical protein FH972_021562 [Carpinus fangiana]|uniref:Uncharacterized protein n=1 Tax=Carpinus fangiana TaxID=176857 RepID=A0A5N6KQC3_9ROSI|nr:hypothetical protein FH972_021562 [Carpinus fangiana]